MILRLIVIVTMVCADLTHYLFQLIVKKAQFEMRNHTEATNLETI